MIRTQGRKAADALLKNSTVKGEIHFRSKDGAVDIKLNVEQQGNYFMEKYIDSFLAEAYIHGVDENEVYEPSWAEEKTDDGENCEEEQQVNTNNMEENLTVIHTTYGAESILDPGTPIMGGKYRAVANDNPVPKEKLVGPGWQYGLIYGFDGIHEYDEELMHTQVCMDAMDAMIAKPEDVIDDLVAIAEQARQSLPVQVNATESQSGVEDSILDMNGVANYLRIGQNKTYALTKLPDFPCEMQGRKFVVSQVNLDAWKANHPNFAELARQLSKKQKENKEG